MSRRHQFRFGGIKAGTTFLSLPQHEMTFTQAREFARCQPGKGYVWWLVCRGSGKHWAIVANYNDGSVWNGEDPSTPSQVNPTDDWRYLGHVKAFGKEPRNASHNH